MDKLYNLFGTFSTANGAKYYVEQQLAKMQVHYMNRSIINLGLSRQSFYKQGLKEMLNKIFKEYETLIQADKYGWVKVEGKMYCVPIIVKNIKNTKNKSIVLNIEGAYTGRKSAFVEGKDIFLGIFPPLAGLEVVLKPYVNENNKKKLSASKKENCRLIKEQNYASIITKAVERITKTAETYMSNLEYWVLQIEALEQDLSIL